MSLKQPGKKPGFFSGMMSSVKRVVGGTFKFFQDVKSEMKKVVWPTRTQIINNTVITLVVVFVVGLFLFGLDSVLGLGIKLLLQGRQ